VTFIASTTTGLSTTGSVTTATDSWGEIAAEPSGRLSEEASGLWIVVDPAGGVLGVVSGTCTAGLGATVGEVLGVESAVGVEPVSVVVDEPEPVVGVDEIVSAVGELVSVLDVVDAVDVVESAAGVLVSVAGGLVSAVGELVPAVGVLESAAGVLDSVAGVLAASDGSDAPALSADVVGAPEVEGSGVVEVAGVDVPPGVVARARTARGA
jgi:hypothetical protein